MNAFNRLLAVLLALALTAVGGLTLAVAAGWLHPDALLRYPWSHLLAPAYLAEGAEWRWVVAGSVAAMLGGLALFVVELSSLAPRPREIRIRSTESGEVRVSLRSVRELADRLGGEHPSVRGIRTRVRERRGGVEVLGDVSVDPTVPLPHIAEELQSAIRQGVERFLGLSVTEVRLTARLGPVLAAGRSTRVQ